MQRVAACERHHAALRVHAGRIGQDARVVDVEVVPVMDAAVRIGRAPALALADLADRPVFCTLGEKGILVTEPKASTGKIVPGFPVTGPIDSVGAGDSTSAGIACALACGMSVEEAAAFGNLIASITIQQLGTTGSATPEQVRERWKEVGKD